MLCAFLSECRGAEEPLARTHVETECKLIAPNAAALKRLESTLREVCDDVRCAGRELIQDIYLDTEDWSLYRAGLACRIRRASDTVVLTLKALLPARDMVSVRTEFEESLAPSLASRVRGLPAARLSRRLASLAGDKPLRQLFRVRNRRRTFEVRCGRALTALVSADDFTVSAGAKSRRLAEVEIEAIEGTHAALRRLARSLARRLGLATGTRTKFEQGLLIAGHRPPRSGA